MNKDLYHVNSSTRNVGGGSLGARKTTFNSAYAGRDSIHDPKIEVINKARDPSASTLLKSEEDQISVYLFDLSHLLKTL